ncbi:hypothetical protein [Rodentibacter caecimuris]|uniref:hypothetical protein n=1 Tax=Rodentibacter caecimuris TaxID=1796644 RepID=UPI00224899C2|nr:hypothetical protein [Rodentibacter heylii]MCX2960335.1 hypothetical protein [Rodentibacter heylii]
MKKHNRKMKQPNSNLEIAKELLLNEQKGSPKNFKLVEVKNSLSDSDKERIKEAVLKNAINLTHLDPSGLAKELIDSIKIINQA